MSDSTRDEYNGLNALEKLNLFRNKYYSEGNSTENGIVANSINAILPLVVEILRYTPPYKDMPVYPAKEV